MQSGRERSPKAESQPLSIVASRIVQEALRPDVSVADLGTLAQSDPGFATRVLSTVNSAAFGFTRKVADVRHACTLLGIRGLRNVGLALVLTDMIPTGDGGRVLLGNSLRRAVAARLIATHLGEHAPDEYFTLGLFLEVAILARARDNLDSAVDIARMPAAHRIVGERAAGLPSHAASGEAVAASCGLPPAFAQAIATHHQESPPPGRWGSVAWAAERVASIWEGGAVAAARDGALWALDAIGLPPDAAQDVLNQVPELVKQAATAFHRELLDEPSVEQLVLDANRTLVEMNASYEALVRRLESTVAEREQLAEQLRCANLQLTQLAATDGLTLLPNRRAFEEELARMLAHADRNVGAMGVALVDIDFFKHVNDTWGHAAGDCVLRGVADLLKQCVRASDMAARWGGEEFALILTGASLEGARIVAERVRARIQATPIETSFGVISVTASIGVSVVKGPGCKEASTRLMHEADQALYESKRGGRNKVSVHPETPVAA